KHEPYRIESLCAGSLPGRQIHNSASVPVTITGVDATPSDWEGPVAGPTIENGDARTLEPVKGPFRDVHIGPDGYGIVTLVYRANPRAICGTGGRAGWIPSTCASRRSASFTTPRRFRWAT